MLQDIFSPISQNVTIVVRGQYFSVDLWYHLRQNLLIK